MNGNRKSRFKDLVTRWLPAITMMGMIFYFSSIPSSKMVNFGSWDTLVKKSGHFFGYALLGLTYLRASKSLSWRACGLSLLFVVIYALSDEYHQSFVAGRTSTLMDVGIDSLGAMVGLILAKLIQSLGRLVIAGVERSSLKESR